MLSKFSLLYELHDIIGKVIIYSKKFTGSSKNIFIVFSSIISTFDILFTFSLYTVSFSFKASIVNFTSFVVKLVPSCQYIFSLIFIIYVLSFILDISSAKSFSNSKFLFIFNNGLNINLSIY